jgi:hypothetical protein
MARRWPGGARIVFHKATGARAACTATTATPQETDMADTIITGTSRELRTLRGGNAMAVIASSTQSSGWAACYRGVVSSRLSGSLDHYLWHARAYAARRKTPPPATERHGGGHRPPVTPASRRS